MIRYTFAKFSLQYWRGDFLPAPAVGHALAPGVYGFLDLDYDADGRNSDGLFSRWRHTLARLDRWIFHDIGDFCAQQDIDDQSLSASRGGGRHALWS